MGELYFAGERRIVRLWKQRLCGFLWEATKSLRQKERAGGVRMKKRLKKTGQRAAAVMAAFCMIGVTVLPVQAAGLKTLRTGMDAFVRPGWEEIIVGSSLIDIYTDQSMYSPGEAVRLTVEFGTGRAGKESLLRIRVRHLNQVVWEQERQVGAETQAETFVIELPGEDFKGYAVEAYLEEQGQIKDYRMTAIDVSSDWNRFPRYGYITKLDYRSDEEIATTLNRLKKHHINGLFYYDVFDSQEQPLAGTVDNPDGEWKSLAKQTVDAQSLKKTIAAGHSLNMRSFFYNLIFGAYDHYEEQGILPEWGLYKDQRHQHQDSHDLGGDGWETPKLWMFNPADENWQKHFNQVHKDFLDVYDFDGLQMDSLGARGSKRFDYQGNELELDQTYVPFLDRLEKEVQTRVIFNPVGGYGLQQVLNSGVYDIIYVEVWPGDCKDYLSLKKVLDQIYAVTKGERGSVIGAYMDYNVMKGEPFNLPGILYTNAMLAAAGGSHLELGDTGMLSNEYYPGNSLRISRELEKRVRNYYSFMVAYENFLRGTGLFEVAAKTQVGGVTTSSNAELGKVYSFTKKKGNQTIVQLLNYDGASSYAWVDSRGAQTAPVVKRQGEMVQSVDFVPNHVYFMSPDYQEGIMEELEFTYNNGEVRFVLPYLEYWDMVVIE